MVSWVRGSGRNDVKSVDVAAHRRQSGVTPAKDEEERLNLGSLTINSHRSMILSYRAMPFEDENDLENAVKAYEQANALSANLDGGRLAQSGPYVAPTRDERPR